MMSAGHSFHCKHGIPSQCSKLGVPFVQALHENIMELELALNEVTPEGAQALAVALSRLPRLQRLNLRENELENAGAIAIAKGLTGLKDLRELDLTQNQVLQGPP